MIRVWLALAVLCAGTVWGAAPSYSLAGIVNASNYEPGPFAPGSVISIFGKNLARSTHSLTNDDLVACPASRAGRCLPTEMNYVRVYIQGLTPVPLLFVSEGQINFIMSSVERPGPVTVRVVTQGISGPEITVTLVDSAPALFTMTGGFAISTDSKGNLLTADTPAHAGDIVVIYATGLGLTSPNPAVGEIPSYAASICQMSPTTGTGCSAAQAFASLRVTLGGKTVNPALIKYAGLTPWSAGLYQINLELPWDAAEDPEIQVTAGNLPLQTALKLPVR